jgi:cytochrome c oxidase assembly factor CtaG
VGGLSALDDQVLAGLIMWVPGSVVYLVPAFVITMRVVAGKGLTRR